MKSVISALNQTPRPILMLLGAAILTSTVALAPEPESKEEAAVRSVAQLYIDGAKTADAAYFEKAFDVASTV